MADEKEDKKVRLQIKIDDEIAGGKYANLVMVTHGESEFIMDFMLVQPGRAEANVGSRVIIGPRQAKRLMGALKENLARYEERFGPLNLPDEPTMH